MFGISLFNKKTSDSSPPSSTPTPTMPSLTDGPEESAPTKLDIKPDKVVLILKAKNDPNGDQDTEVMTGEEISLGEVTPTPGQEEEEEEDVLNSDSISDLPSPTSSLARSASSVLLKRDPNTQEIDAKMSLVHKALDMLLENRFSEAADILERQFETDMHFAVGYGAMLTFQAIMTFDNKEIQKGYTVLGKGLELADAKRQSKAAYLRMKSPTYQEVVAELLYAETLLLTSLLTLAQSDSVIAMVKGALKGRTSYTIYKDLYNKYVSKADRRASIRSSSGVSESPTLEGFQVSDDFISGILLGYGTFQIALAMVPPKLLKLLELVGLNGSTEVGLAALARGDELDGLRSPFCAQAILVYHTAFKFNLDPYNIDLKEVDALLDKHLARHPNCASFVFFRGRSAVIKRNLPLANSIFLDCIKLQNEWKTMHHTCWWEMLWSSALIMRWDLAAEYAEKLFGSSNWSKSTYLYLLAAFRYTHWVDKDPLRKYANDANITTLFKDVKDYQIRIAGKKLQIEKYCVRKARSYKHQNNFLFLPAVEALYVWGMFVLLEVEVAQRLMLLIEERLSGTVCPDDHSHKNWEDDQCLGYLMMGTLSKHCYLISKSNTRKDSQEVPEEVLEGYLKKAETKLLKAIGFEKDLHLDHFLIAWSNYELSELYWLRNDYDKSTAFLKASRKVSTKVKYSLESRLMFKIHNLSQRIKELKPPVTTTPSSSSSYFKSGKSKKSDDS